MRKTLFALPLAALMFGGAAHAEGMATVEARQAYFKALGASMKIFAESAKSFDAEKVKAEAAQFEKTLATDVAPLFAPGTSDADFPGKSRAKANIWENMDDFGAKGKAMHEAAAALIVAANSGDAATFGPAVGKLGGTCKACHDDYRVPDQ